MYCKEEKKEKKWGSLVSRGIRESAKNERQWEKKYVLCIMLQCVIFYHKLNENKQKMQVKILRAHFPLKFPSTHCIQYCRHIADGWATWKSRDSQDSKILSAENVKNSLRDKNSSSQSAIPKKNIQLILFQHHSIVK